MARLFFALWPDAAAAAALHALAEALAVRTGGRAVPAAKIHLTLAFLGEVPAGRIEAAMLAAAAIEEGSIPVSMDCIGAFRRARVAWAGSREPAPGLLRMQASLARELGVRGFEPEERPFSPHATLVRRTERALRREPTDAIAWIAGEFALVRSEAGTGAYATLATWPLALAAPK